MKIPKDMAIQRGSTWFLRAAVVGFALLIFVIAAFSISAVYLHWAEEYPEAAFARLPAAAGLTLSAIGCFVAVYQTLKILHYIDKNTAFSEQSVQALRVIKYCGIAVGLVYVLGLPVIYHMAQQEDAPGLVVIGLVCAAAPLAIATLSAVLQKLLRSAIGFKSENELTV